jgi:hypothetical protein
MRSRTDLQRLNFIMGHASLFCRNMVPRHKDNPATTQPLRLVELGAGDGTLLLRMARRWATLGVMARVTLVDRHDLASDQTRRSIVALNWSVECVTADVYDWLSESTDRADVMIANLFLHHFTDDQLKMLFRLAATRTNQFIACEPQRSLLPLAASRCLRLIGCNGITRHDAVVSVQAGFVGSELTALWPVDREWELHEQPGGMFSHCFVAQRNA